MKFTKLHLLLCGAFIMTSYAQETWDGSTDTDWSGNGDTTSWGGNTYSNATGAIFDGSSGLGTVNITGVVNPSSLDNTVNAAGYTFNIASGGKLELSGVTVNSDVIYAGGSGSGAIRGNSAGSVINGSVQLSGNIDVRGNDITWSGGVNSSSNASFGINGARHIIDTAPVLIGTGDFGVTSTGANKANAVQLNVGGNVWDRTNITFDGYLLLGGDDYLPSNTEVYFGWSRGNIPNPNTGAHFGLTASWSDGILDLDGNNQTIGGLTFNSNSDGLGGNQRVVNTGTTQSTLTINKTSGSLEYQGRFEGDLNIVKTGAGEQILDNQSLENNTDTVINPNTYSGTTTVSGGILSLAGTTSIDSSSEIAIANGAVFSVAATSDKTFGNAVSGTGSIVGDFTSESSSGSINPGDGSTGIGTLSFQNNLTLATGADINLTLAMALGNEASLDPTSASNGIPNSGEHDALSVTGALDLTGVGDINLSLDAGYTPMEGDYFDLFDSASLIGANEGALTLPSLSGGLSWDTSSFTTNGIVMIVPEPTSSVLFGLGALGLLVRRRR